MSVQSYEVGARIRDLEGFRATVRYIGPVAAAKNTEELWLGVEWDKSDRGKHDGSCVDSQGILHRYFDCASGYGSFVKPAKLHNRKTFSEALRERYVEIDAPEIIGPDHKLADSFIVTSKGRQKAIEFVGEKKLRKWQQISVVDKVAIRDENIHKIGDDVSSIAGHLVEIDLQDNLIYEWLEIAKLTANVQNLRTLLLHGNRFQKFDDRVLSTIPSGAFNNLTTIALNNCGIRSWRDVVLLESVIPNLEELYLAANDFSDLPVLSSSLCSIFERIHVTSTTQSDSQNVPTNVVGGFPRLRILDLADCKIGHWEQVGCFAMLPALQELILDNNPISTITPRATIAQHCNTEIPVFANLTRVSLSYSRITNWSDIDALSTFETIKQLRLSHIPLFTGKGASEVRPKVIARIANLNFFNGSGISPRERSDSEKAYLRAIMRDIEEQNQANGAKVDTNNIHPRYQELNTRYAAEMLEFGKSAQSGLTLAADMIQVTFHNMAVSTGVTEPVTKKIPSSITISRLKLMVKQMFGLAPRVQLLSIQVYKDGMPTLLDDDQSNLSYYGAMDGADIYINEDKSDK